jgi:hypothetical protein
MKASDPPIPTWGFLPAVWARSGCEFLRADPAERIRSRTSADRVGPYGWIFVANHFRATTAFFSSIPLCTGPSIWPFPHTMEYKDKQQEIDDVEKI